MNCSCSGVRARVCCALWMPLPVSDGEGTSLGRGVGLNRDVLSLVSVMFVGHTKLVGAIMAMSQPLCPVEGWASAPG